MAVKNDVYTHLWESDRNHSTGGFLRESPYVCSDAQGWDCGLCHSNDDTMLDWKGFSRLVLVLVWV